MPSPKSYVAASLLSFCPIAAQADVVLNILVGNLDVVYDGGAGQVSDAQAPNTVFSLNPAESFGVTSTDIEVDSVIDTQLTSPPDLLFVDYSTSGLGAGLSLGSYTETANPGLLDLFSTTAGLELLLNLNSLNYLIVDSSVPGADLFSFNAEADVISQTIPNGREFGETVLVSYTATDADLTIVEGQVTALTASGQLTITGTNVPEPSSLALIGLGAAALIRRRRAA